MLAEWKRYTPRVGAEGRHQPCTHALGLAQRGGYMDSTCTSQHSHMSTHDLLPYSLASSHQGKKDVHQLDTAVQHFFEAGLSTSTHKTYKSAEKRYLQFCNQFSVKPFPASESALCYYVACLGQEGLTHATIKTYLAGVRQIQIAQGFPDLAIQTMPRLRQIIRGVRVEQGKLGRAPRTRLPITPAILRKMKKIWEEQGVSWAASTLAFFAFCRSGEITVPCEGGYDPTAHLSFNDLAVDNAKLPSQLSMRLKKTKTDPFREGVRVTIGVTKDDLCPIGAMMAYLVYRGSKDGPLFCWPDGTPLTRTRFVQETRTALTKANLPAKDFAGHSFHIGAASTAAAVGLEDSLIQTLGRWKSAAYLLYVRLDPGQLAKVAVSLASCQI